MKIDSMKHILAISLIIAISLLSSACSTKKSIVGIWRLESGKYDGLEQCVIEFTDIGEFIIYDGEGLHNDRSRGSFTYNEKQIDMINSGIFHVINNYVVENDQLTLVTSNGKAIFQKVNTNAEPKQFDEDEVVRLYAKQDYSIIESQNISTARTSRVYRIVINKSYNYADIQTTKEDEYEYSQFGEYWYLSKSEVISSEEKWHDIIGHYDGSFEKTLDITFFDGKTISYKFYDKPLFDYPIRSEQTYTLEGKNYNGQWVIPIYYTDRYTNKTRQSGYFLLDVDRGLLW